MGKISEILRENDEKRQFISRIKDRCNQLFQENRDLVFIPAGRSLLATLSDQLYFVDPKTLDFLMRNFLSRISIIRPLFNRPILDLLEERRLLGQQDIDLDKANLAIALINKILKGEYHYDRSGEKIFYGNNKYVRLKFASSGQQESLWILLLLFVIVLEKQNTFLVIEEPEAHLFPEDQKEISKLIALVSNIENTQVVITTHSPYILASIELF